MKYIIHNPSTLILLWLLCPLFFISGCGTTKQQKATQQLLMSNAVDRTISQIDFSDLAYQKVYFDTKYIGSVKGTGFVNSNYIISSLRQQMITQHCHLVDKREDAEFILEGRIGTLGADAHDVTYGLPANNSLSTASSIMPNLPPMPTIPEISVAKRSEQLAAVKIGIFAYHRETGMPVWKSGIVQENSTAKDTWIFGMGPFQRGTIYEKTRFAGSSIKVNPFLKSHEEKTEMIHSFASEQHYPGNPHLEIGHEKHHQDHLHDHEKPHDDKNISSIAKAKPKNKKAIKKEVVTVNHETAAKKPPATATASPAITPLQKVTQHPKLLSPPIPQSDLSNTKEEKPPKFSNGNLTQPAGI